MIRFIVTLFAVLLALTGCGGTLNVDVQKALVFEQQVQTEVTYLRSVAEAAIPMLPVEKQQAARDALADAYGKVCAALTAKDDALQAALLASAQSVDITAVALQIAQAVQEIIALVESFGAKQEQLIEPKARLAAMKARLGAK